MSSFGHTGTNAHVVIGEYVEQGEESLEQGMEEPVLIVLSAKTEERLKAVAANLHDFLNSDPPSSILDLRSLAYTLQVGREAMAERLGLIVTSQAKLQEKLKGFLEDRDAVENLFRGRAKSNSETAALFAGDEDLQTAIDVWISKGKYAKLLDLWVTGLIFDWSKLYGDSKPHHISLPTYPFARERYWIESSAEFAISGSGLKDKLHPLVHENTSTLGELRFSSTFTGEEIFIADYLLHGRKMLPGAAYLEMARAAVEQAVGLAKEDWARIQFNNIEWITPLTFNSHAEKVHIGLFPQEGGGILYEIYTSNAKTDKDVVVHSQGVVAFTSPDKIPMLDLKALRKAFTKSLMNFKSCEEIYIGNRKILARLSFPSYGDNRFFVHPCLLDRALQVAAELTAQTREPRIGNPKSLLPSILPSLEIFSPCPSTPWTLIRHNEGKLAEPKLDIDLCDENGNVCIRIQGLTCRDYADAASEALVEISSDQDPMPVLQKSFENDDF